MSCPAYGVSFTATSPAAAHTDCRSAQLSFFAHVVFDQEEGLFWGHVAEVNAAASGDSIEELSVNLRDIVKDACSCYIEKGYSFKPPSLALRHDPDYVSKLSIMVPLLIKSS